MLAGNTHVRDVLAAAEVPLKCVDLCGHDYFHQWMWVMRYDKVRRDRPVSRVTLHLCIQSCAWSEDTIRKMNR